jgi:hypothetical protein
MSLAMASLEQFLRFGTLGAIRLGVTRSELVAQLGEPPDESVQHAPKILKYGGLQITFTKPNACTEPRVARIGLYFHTPNELIPDQVELTDWAVNSETTLVEMRSFLDKSGLAAHQEKLEDDDRLDLASGAQIIFSNQKLWSILVGTRNRQASNKQVSVSIPLEAWRELNAIARQTNRSVAELCGQWIAQHAKELQSNPKLS